MSPSRPSLSPPDSARAREGRTPPPAPSAAYARRAREIMEDEGLPSLTPIVVVTPQKEKENDVAAGYRRARAGTMPSMLHEAFQTQSDEPDLPPITATTYRTSALSPSYLVNPLTPPRPALRHTASSAANLETSTSANRLRSGSLTQVTAAAFGTSDFSSAWLNNPTPARSPLGKEIDDPLNAYTSPSESAASLITDDLNFSTLDYLGLANDADLPPASMTEVRSQAQRAIANFGPASRLRASTISNVNRPLRPSVTDNNIYGDEEILAKSIANLGMDDNPYASFNSTLPNLYGSQYSSSFKENRPRATTIGALDNPMRRSGSSSRSHYLSSIPQSPTYGYQQNPNMGYGGYPPNSRDSSRGPRLSISSHTSRAGTPDVLGGGSTPQVPTRSLWIGNLDVDATSEGLLHVFAPYGPIESVRMLPEKTCAFVNFMERPDAIRARDDVLNRLGGHVAALSETAPVRIGFGKIDSVPTVPMITSISPNPFPGLSYASGPPSAVTIPPQTVTSLVSPDLGGDASTSPTRALWIGSIPGTTGSATLLQIFSPFGPVESARVLSAKCCGFINFERLDSAISARNALNGLDILGSDIGPIRIGFARVPTRSPSLVQSPDPNLTLTFTPNPRIKSSSSTKTTPIKLSDALSNVEGASAVSPEKQISAEGGGVENYRSQFVIDLVKAGVAEEVLEKGLTEGGTVSEEQMIIQVLGGGRREEEGDVKAAAENRLPTTYYTSIPIIQDRSIRRFDSARLKDLRKRLDTGLCEQDEIDQITADLLEDCAELSSDYIGNTIVQKLFERCNPTLRFAMLNHIAPHLAMLSIHKNGTWAAQKVIECSTKPEERDLIISHLRPFVPPLMCDNLGNYVCAGTLKFGAPWSGVIWDAMVDRLWDIAQSRFGARCMRTCLESPNASLYQKKRVAAGIILNSIPLATNPNGALLLTWLVDSSGLPGRQGLLAQRFAPHVAHLCSHKLASLTVLRIITQTPEPKASEILINAIFTSPSDQVLLDVLSDPNGAQVVGKILATSTLPSEGKPALIESVRRVLPTIRASVTPPYRLLLEAVGLPVPAGTSPFNRPYAHSHSPQHHPQQGFYSPSPQQYRGQSQSPGYGNGQGLSPLLMPQNMPLGQGMRGGMMGSPGLGPRTPQGRSRGRLSPGPGPGSMMMSPGSDPFNPFASPSIDAPYFQNHNNPTPGLAAMRLSSTLSQPPMTNFSPQPNIGGLGLGGGLGGGGNGYYQGQGQHQGQSHGHGHNQNMYGMYAGYQG